ncbi:MAG: hypothetical protein WBW73_12625 [Rhodoplanes sp.]
MSVKKLSFNPGRFADAISKNLYARGLGKASALRRERRRRARLLRKGKTAAHQELAARLDSCKPRARCRSGACPECNYAAQKLYTRLLRNFIGKHAGSRTIAAVTLIPTQIIPPGNLSVASHRRAVDRLKYALRRAGVPWFVGGVDYSFNEHATNRYPGGWAWHVHGFAPTKNIDRLKRRLKRRFPKTDAVPRPVKVLAWDGRSIALRYTLKANFERRIGRDGGQRFSKTKGKRTCRVTEKQRLRSAEKRELLLHLDQIGFGGRMLLRCAQFLNARAPEIVLRPPNAVRGSKGVK